MIHPVGRYENYKLLAIELQLSFIASSGHGHRVPNLNYTSVACCQIYLITNGKYTKLSVAVGSSVTMTVRLCVVCALWLSVAVKVMV